MNFINWIKKNITISIVITLLCGYGVGAMAYGALRSDVARLKSDVSGVPERLAAHEERLNSIHEHVIEVKGDVKTLVKRELRNK